MSVSIEAWANALCLIDPRRVAGVVRACDELERHCRGAGDGAARLCLLVCAVDDLLDSQAQSMDTRRALLADVGAAVKGDGAADVCIAPDWPAHRDELARLFAELRARSPGQYPAFVAAFVAMLEAMRTELGWQEGHWPNLEEYLRVCGLSIAAPAVCQWLAAWQGVDLGGSGRALLASIGPAIRLANDLADRDRERGEGKINAVGLVERTQGVSEERARRILQTRLSEYVIGAEQVVAGAWGEAVLAFTRFLVSAYARAGDFMDPSASSPSSELPRSDRRTPSSARG